MLGLRGFGTLPLLLLAPCSLPVWTLFVSNWPLVPWPPNLRVPREVWKFVWSFLTTSTTPRLPLGDRCMSLLARLVQMLMWARLVVPLPLNILIWTSLISCGPMVPWTNTLTIGTLYIYPLHSNSFAMLLYFLIHLAILSCPFYFPCSLQVHHHHGNLMHLHEHFATLHHGPVEFLDCCWPRKHGFLCQHIRCSSSPIVDWS